MSDIHAPARWKIWTAFSAVYFLWGSTYLAMRFAITSLPPFLMAATRFLTAGAALYLWERGRGTPGPDRRLWKVTAISGTLLLFTGNGGVVWAVQYVPSGLTAVLVAMVPLWIVVLMWVWQKRGQPDGRTLLGIFIGMAGIAVLVGPERLLGSGAVDPAGMVVLILASLSWAAGSLYSTHRHLKAPPLLATGMQMLCGGFLLLVLGLLAGEGQKFSLEQVSLQSLLALIYLIVFGSLIGFTAYLWLLRVTTPAHASTYAFVNPLIAVILGWAIGGESLTARTLVATLLIVTAVIAIVLNRPPMSLPKPASGAEVPSPSPPPARPEPQKICTEAC
ncbi:MAG: EamA family transporter [candidate division KSB1 bacterium]|nr:EamA family transporter [candidate division KSB1 bacterium]MDZ7275554.1 EamA family transporter [candidate division KSB1 bacterium]MDZ7286134.1 EamA family transporter [candidate division KSB1 bacterium]MDZ7296360.1 EamA family transporter [candidate division KSB1 bacterium]MDZ7307136.1 EamA family transporter [candidate division KSB1 bacterium]